MCIFFQDTLGDAFANMPVVKVRKGAEASVRVVEEYKVTGWLWIWAAINWGHWCNQSAIVCTLVLIIHVPSTAKSLNPFPDSNFSSKRSNSLQSAGFYDLYQVQRLLPGHGSSWYGDMYQNCEWSAQLPQLNMEWWDRDLINTADAFFFFF